MTAAARAGRRPVRRRSLGAAQAGCVGAGMLALLARPALAGSTGWTVPVVVVLFASVLALGLASPVGPASPVAPVRGGSRTSTAAITLAGVALFAAGRLMAGGRPAMTATLSFVALNTLAAVAEEALLHRSAYALLEKWGPPAAVAGTATLFALAHVTVYGWWAAPVDFGAGLVLGWQRWASGRWAVPAFTHAFADLLAVL